MTVCQAKITLYLEMTVPHLATINNLLLLDINSQLLRRETYPTRIKDPLGIIMSKLRTQTVAVCSKTIL